MTEKVRGLYIEHCEKMKKKAAVLFVGIFAKGQYRYTPSEHIERTRPDSMWISTTGKRGSAKFWSRKRGSSGYIAIINLNKIPGIFIYDTRIPGMRNGFSDNAKKYSKDHSEVLIKYHIQPRAIKNVVHRSRF